MVLGFAQQRADILTPFYHTSPVSSLKNLEAKFTADVTQGSAPLSVQFTDQSTGNPLSWKWTFGDGDSSLSQNPAHIYTSTGVFTVKLVVSDGTNSFALEKKDYISVSHNYANCDTLQYPLPEPLTYYTITGKGYVTGNNTYADKAICDYFDNMQPNLVITGLLCEFSKAKQMPGNNETLSVNVWKLDGGTGKPGILLGSDSLKLSTVVNDVAGNKFTSLGFADHIQPGSSFFMGITLPVITGDTVCLWSTSSGKLPVNTTWIQQSDNVWESAQALWTPQGGPEFIISTAIYPKVCLLIGIDETEVPLAFAIWPNPADDVISIVNQDNKHDNAHYLISDISGKPMLKGDMANSLATSVDVSMLPAGFYIVRIRGNTSDFSTKLVIR